MAARLTDRQKKKILADYVQTNNYCATAKINGVSATTVKNLVRANADIVEKCEQKKEENTADVMAYIFCIAMSNSRECTRTSGIITMKAEQEH